MSESQLSSLVERIGDPVSSEDIERWVAAKQAEDRSHKLREVLRTWGATQASELPLRKLFAVGVLILLSAQVLAIFVYAYLLGGGVFHAEEWVATTFMLGALGEVSALALVVTRYLFPDSAAQVLSVIEKL